MPPIRVVLIDDHKHFHEAVSTILATVDDISLIAQGYDGEEAIWYCRELQPDIVLMDVVMPIMDGITATQAVRQIAPATKILVLSSVHDYESVRAMLENGASGYVIKGALAHDLINTIRGTHQGKSVFSPGITDVLLSPPQDQTDFNLTARELEVLKLMGQGHNNNQIAYDLSISTSTVKFHINNILHKFDVATRSEVLVMAAKNGLI